MRGNTGAPSSVPPTPDTDEAEDDLAIALRLSEEQERLLQEQIMKEEEIMLARVLELSMKEK